jgi:hypothetical protein
MKRLRVLQIVALLAVFPASAGGLPQPKTKAILEIAGSIEVTNSEGVARFDRDMLEALGTEEIATKTPWHNGLMRFSGVRLDKLMRLVGAKGKAVTATAINDYVTTIPIDDFARFGVILALKMNGKYMSVREKGPLFIIYPFDSDPALQTQQYLGRSAWQVVKLKVH